MSTNHYILPFQTSYAQLEEAFKSMADRLVVSDEEKSRLEVLVAQLEMESSTIGEYITMFAHRRQHQVRGNRSSHSFVSTVPFDIFSKSTLPIIFSVDGIVWL